MKKIINSLTLLLLLFTSNQTLAQSVELQGVGGIDCVDNKFYLSIRIQATDVNTFNIGNSTIYIDYDPEVLQFDALQFTNFKANQACTNGTKPWAGPTYHGGLEGVLVMTTILTEGSETNSCPDITNSIWVEVAQASFNVSEIPDEGDLYFNVERTNFNTNVPNTGNPAIAKGAFTMLVNNCQGDFDSDGILDIDDNCPTIANSNQEDADNDNIGDVCDDSCLGLTAYAGPDRLVCEGESSILLASGLGGTKPYNYLWSTGETNNIITVDPYGAVIYYLTVTDDIGCSDVDTLNIAYTTQAIDSLYFYDQDNSVPIALIEEGMTYNIDNFPTDFNIEAYTSSGASSVAFTLRYQGQWADDGTDNSTPWRFSPDLLPGRYTLTATTYSDDNAFGTTCATTTLSFILIDACPITNTGTNPLICPTDSATLSAGAQGLHPPFSYLWTDSLITVAYYTESITVSPSLTTSYFLTVTDANGCSFTDKAVVYVNPSASNCDIDSDGVLNLTDECPYTQEGAIVNSIGCTDNDLDGTYPDAILSDPNFDPNDENGCIPGIYTIDLQLSLLMEGPLTDPTDPTIFLPTMRADLTTSGQRVLPGMTSTPSGQPYSVAPWNYQGTEGDNWTITDYQNHQNRIGKLIVDWVLVSFRSSPNAADEFLKKAGLLLEDGSVDFLGDCILSTAYQPEDLYIVIEHRNHLGIMTASPALVANQVLTFDFKNQDSYLGAGTAVGVGQKEVAPDQWVMYSGDADQINDLGGYDINAQDRILWENQNGAFSSYRAGDLNFDGDVNGVDKILWRLNNGLSSRMEK